MMAEDLLDLPRRVTLNGRTLVLDVLSLDQYASAYNLVRLESAEGEDVGLDEFPTPTSLYSHLDHAHCFSLSSPTTTATTTTAHPITTTSIRAFISITPSAYCRSQEPILAGGLVICDIAIKNDIIVEVIRLALRLTDALGFEGVLADVFSSSPVVNTLRSEGFTVIARIPNSGHVRGRGWTDSLVMFRNLHSNKPQKEFDPVLVPARGQSSSNTKPGHEGQPASVDYGEAVPISLSYMVQKPNLKYLPCPYTFKNGTKVHIRYACEADIPSLFAIYKSAAEQGQGFSFDEFSNIDVFRFYVIDHGHPIVAVDAQTSQIVLSFSLTPSVLCRSADPQLADPYLVIQQGYRKKGIGFDAVALMLRITKDLGYAGVVTDVMCDNTPALHVMKNVGFTVVGHIPDAVTGKGDHQNGDVVICFKDLIDHSHHFAKL